MPKPLREKDIDILFDARDATDGCVSRTRLVEAFKRAGASVDMGTTLYGQETIGGNAPARVDLCLVYTVAADGTGKSLHQMRLPVGRGDVRFDTFHKGWRVRLSQLAGHLIRDNGLELAKS